MLKYEDLVDLNKIIEQYKIIRSKTKNKQKLFSFEMFYSCNIISILKILRLKQYRHSRYHVFLVSEPKYRLIMSEIMSDKIINHMVSKYVLEPLIYPRLIGQNVATRPEMGTKKGIYYVKKYINKLKMHYDNIYVLKCDVKKYFYSIDHEILKNKLANLIEDAELLKMIYNIIDSTNLDYINDLIDKAIKKEIDRVKSLNIKDADLKVEELSKIPGYIKGKGLPIGNMTSQILAIYYLNDLDKYIKEELHCKYYIRYMDDFLIFHYDKEN